MILKITEEVITDTREVSYREYEYITAADNAVDAIKNFIYEFDTDNVFNCEDLFDGECLSSEVCKIEVMTYDYI